MSLAWPMTRFAASNFSFPTADLGKLGMRCMREGFELILVAVHAGFAADIVSGAGGCGFGLVRLNGRLNGRLNAFGSTAGGYPHKCSSQRGANEQRFDDSFWTQLSALTL